MTRPGKEFSWPAGRSLWDSTPTTEAPFTEANPAWSETNSKGIKGGLPFPFLEIEGKL